MNARDQRAAKGRVTMSENVDRDSVASHFSSANPLDTARELLRSVCLAGEESDVIGLKAVDVSHALQKLIEIAHRRCTVCDGFKTFTGFGFPASCPGCGAKHGERKQQKCRNCLGYGTRDGKECSACDGGKLFD